MSAYEVNFDGLVGPTHNYSGLSFGNLASKKNRALVASPKSAALQGLQKMKALADMGLKQAVLPPHERPYISGLRKLGFDAKKDEDVIVRAGNEAPWILSSLSSASNMWVANAATVSPYTDTLDGKTHFTPANLNSMFHRSIEHEQTGRILKSIFSSEDYVHHQALPSGPQFADEGAANHTRLCSDYGAAGTELFVYGAPASGSSERAPSKFPARQTRAASEAIARLHGLDANKTIFAQQNPDVIDAGVFHNDVIAVGNGNLLFFHERAFQHTRKLKDQIERSFDGQEFCFVEVPNAEVGIAEAVRSYMFNTQLVQVPGQQGALLIAPIECREIENVHWYLQTLKDAHPGIADLVYFDLKQSMRNGGGPACLRLRVLMSQQQIDSTAARVFIDDALYGDLVAWVNKHYRDRMTAEDLLDRELLGEIRTALDELTQILGLGNLYDFQ